MKADIARQPPLLAFLTLIIVAAAGVFHAGYEIQMPHTAELSPLGGYLTDFQSAYPMPSRLLALFCALFSGLCLGRLSIRYNLYSGNSYLSIPLYGVVACGIFVSGNYLTQYLASMLLTLSLHLYCRSFRNGHSFGALFRASLFLGMIPLIYTPGLALVLLLPSAIIFFKRTLREFVTALFGVLLPIFILCYVTWGGGGNFTEPLSAMGTGFVAESGFNIFDNEIPNHVILLGSITLLNLASIFAYLYNIYTCSLKARLILAFNIYMFLLISALFFMPSAMMDITALLAVPSAILLPILFVRLHHTISLLLYLSLLVSCFIRIFL